MVAPFKRFHLGGELSTLRTWRGAQQRGEDAPWARREMSSGHGKLHAVEMMMMMMMMGRDLVSRASWKITFLLSEC